MLYLAAWGKVWCCMWCRVLCVCCVCGMIGVICILCMITLLVHPPTHPLTHSLSSTKIHHNTPCIPPLFPPTPPSHHTQDASPVVPRGPPKSITVEDSFKSCDSPQAVTRVLHVLLPDLWSRLVEDAEEHMRWPGTLAVKWRHKGAGFQRTSASVAWPPAAGPVVMAGMKREGREVVGEGGEGLCV